MIPVHKLLSSGLNQVLAKVVGAYKKNGCAKAVSICPKMAIPNPACEGAQSIGWMLLKNLITAPTRFSAAPVKTCGDVCLSKHDQSN